MFAVELTPQAYADLDDMYLYIADRGFPDNALAFTDRVFDFCQQLAIAPHRGRAYFENKPGLRVLAFRDQANICFTVEQPQRKVIVLRILGRGESIERAFPPPH